MPDRKSVVDMLAKVSDGYIKECYSSVQKAFENDAALDDNQKKQFERFQREGAYYGTDVYSDWTEWQRMLEIELKRRNLGA